MECGVVGLHGANIVGNNDGKLGTVQSFLYVLFTFPLLHII